MHPLRVKKIAKEFQFGYSPARICEEYSVSPEMIAAALVESGAYNKMSTARSVVNRRLPRRNESDPATDGRKAMCVTHAPKSA